MRKMPSNSFLGLLVNNKQRKRRDGQSVSLTENVCSASVKSNCAVPPPSRANSWALASLFSLDGKFPVAGTFEMSNAPRWGRKKRANVASSIHTVAVLIDRAVELWCVS